ncbi:MAG: hypothetical protein CVV24_07970 [Ignavibacteriae bacterium HGW-Ignavibacteriae-3]|nr:MAG: hypothetical protein CVV24_07970 [Ignavibacteriae bacterium HGW-Ignavibacteriae-3]
MEKLSQTARIFLFLTLLSLALFLGSYLTRQTVVYQLFEVNGIDLKTMFNGQNLPAVFSVMVPAIILNLLTYYVFLISFIIFLITSGIKLKYEGWLFAILLIVALTAPFEIYLSTIDFQLIQQIISDPSQVEVILNLVKERVSDLSSFPLIMLISSAVIIFLTVFRPLRKTYEN